MDKTDFNPRQVILIDVSSADQSFDPPLIGISIGTAGDLTVDMVAASAVTIPSNCLAVGIGHTMQITKIYKDGTTASELVGWR